MPWLAMTVLEMCHLVTAVSRHVLACILWFTSCLFSCLVNDGGVNNDGITLGTCPKYYKVLIPQHADLVFTVDV